MPFDEQPQNLTMPQGLWRACCLYGLSGSEWECMMVVVLHTIHEERVRARIGMSDFLPWSSKSKVGIYASLKRLRDNGILKVIDGYDAQHSYEYEIADPKKWKWESSRSKFIPDLSLLDPIVPARPANEPISVEAQECAALLREHCLASNPAADVPEANLEDHGFAAWCHYFDRILQRGNTHLSILGAIRWIHASKNGTSKFWAGRVQGRKAASIFSRNVDQILVQYKAGFKPRRT